MAIVEQPGGLKSWWRRTRPYVLSGMMYATARCLGLTLRIRRRGIERIQSLTTGKIYCGWHGKSMIPAIHFQGKGVWAMFSLSNDGELQSRVFRKFGFQVIRGSTGKGGTRAVIEAIRLLRGGAAIAMTPDGPRGPACQVHGGVLMMAQKSGAALIPVGSSAKWRFLAVSWDRYMVALPFSSAVIAFGEPIFVPEVASDQEIESIRARLQEAICRLDNEADIAMGHEPISYPKRPMAEAVSEPESTHAAEAT